MIASDGKEVEVKIRIADPEVTAEQLRKAGFQPSSGRLFESNTLYDTPDHSLRAANRLIRLRTMGETALLTYKANPVANRHKVRDEWETQVSDNIACAKILEGLGLVPTLRYEKYRTAWVRFAINGSVLLDETPIGNFIEIEGTPEWIDSVAAELGFSENDFVLQSYLTLFADYKREYNLQSEHMVFSEELSKQNT